MLFYTLLAAVQDVLIVIVFLNICSCWYDSLEVGTDGLWNRKKNLSFRFSLLSFLNKTKENKGYSGSTVLLANEKF